MIFPKKTQARCGPKRSLIGAGNVSVNYAVDMRPSYDSAMTSQTAARAAMRALHRAPETQVLGALLPAARLDSASRDRINARALGLIADLSEELTQQHKTLLALKLLTEQQQRQLDSLVAQMKAQSSAFLLQGERLLRLEALAEQMPGQIVADEAGNEELQRLSTFDQAIELAHQGATAEVLMSRCGLSVSEAQLVVLVHGKPSAE